MNVIALDAMGGDHAPHAETAGAVAAVREAAIQVVLVGDEPRLRRELRAAGATAADAIEVVHADEVVEMDDHPAHAFRTKKRSSLRLAMDLVVGGQAHGVVSAGNSGAVLAHALLLVGRLPGVDRPGIVTELPTPAGSLVLCDMGANVDVKPTTLAQFGVLAAAYDRIVHRHNRPRLGVLSNGTEDGKGTELTRAAHALLGEASRHAAAPFDYVGYVEGSDLFRGVVDVVATDGFTGNVVLKTCEGLAEAVLQLVRRELDASVRGRVSAALLAPMLRSLRGQLDYAETGGALLAGVAGVVVIAHGRSDATAIKNALKAAGRFAEGSLPTRLGEAVATHRELWKAEVPRVVEGTGG